MSRSKPILSELTPVALQDYIAKQGACQAGLNLIKDVMRIYGEDKPDTTETIDVPLFIDAYKEAEQEHAGGLAMLSWFQGKVLLYDDAEEDESAYYGIREYLSTLEAEDKATDPTENWSERDKVLHVFGWDASEVEEIVADDGSKLMVLKGYDNDFISQDKCARQFGMTYACFEESFIAITYHGAPEIGGYTAVKTWLSSGESMFDAGNGCEWLIYIGDGYGLTLYKKKPIKFTVTYDETTDESASIGDTSDYGYVNEFARYGDYDFISQSGSDKSALKARLTQPQQTYQAYSVGDLLSEIDGDTGITLDGDELRPAQELPEYDDAGTVRRLYAHIDGSTLTGAEKAELRKKLSCKR